MRGDVRRLAMGVEHQIGVLRHLVRVVDPGDLLDQPGARLRARALGGALIAQLERRRDVARPSRIVERKPAKDQLLPSPPTVELALDRL